MGAPGTMASYVEIFDLQKQASTLVLETDNLVEAPNWSPDGRMLVVNSEGRLFRVPLGGEPSLIEIDTGFAKACNNDHGISPDGRHLVISDKSEEGHSCIYLLPLGGGVPERITRNVPSYWHGWSPDGATIAYCGIRGGRKDIYIQPVAGGDETRLTDGTADNDGPDYTPDGNWIWFNSTRSGNMQLWRIRPDGTGLAQMTDDKRNNWFPHPSPDGTSVLYLSYAEGVDGHPRDHEVELRLMPANGGESRSLLGLFGGQGTINVPCWAPDGKQFAYVRYATLKGL